MITNDFLAAHIINREAMPFPMITLNKATHLNIIAQIISPNNMIQTIKMQYTPSFMNLLVFFPWYEAARCTAR